MKMKPTLSIIIPVYNGLSTIGRLLESIYVQDSLEIEVILLNDGSIDDTDYFVKKNYSQKPNFKYLNKENSGVSDTRNLGLSIASADYVLFADSDDFYEEKGLIEIVNFLKKNDNINLLCFNYYNTYSSGEKKRMLNFISTYEHIKNADGLIKYLSGEYFEKFNNAVWNKVYKKEIIMNNNIVFDSSKKIGEDLLFNIEYFLNVDKIFLLDLPIYNYYQQENSVMRRYNNFFLDDLKRYNLILNKIILKYKLNIDKKHLSFFFLSRLFGLISNESAGLKYNVGIQNLNDFREFYKENGYFEELRNFKLNMKYQTFYCILKCKLYNVIYTILYFSNKI